ncbi:hypothetical protein F1737_04590 [Methanoplanus sp. FWC-SCC4]|uniref:Uncharacterized protein n=1 Tax=Methanochimaera problematica TaxID=2609417 RepID=A0AA97FBW7_9EURY|nr:hypothetical protein [Methanoplanus sp. FWC-SCC4]WOF16032.1 hypothetical protein F1737_04590 [Methanoplanus sp. FWC-SCC4]
MEYAYDNESPGKQFIIYAKDLKKIKKESSKQTSKQYTCPFCGEYVGYVYSDKINPHFKHIRDSLIAKTCEKYVEGSGYNSYNYNRKLAGFPIYLRKFGQNFRLYMGLFPVPEDVIKREINSSQKIVLKNPNNAFLVQISLEDLIIDEFTYYSLNWLYEYYSLNYANIPNSLFSHKWVSETPGINHEGAIFFCSDTFSRKVALNGKITTDTDYYLVIPTKKDIISKEFLKIESSNELAVKAMDYEKWSVHKIKFTKITNESSEFARDLHVTLVENPSRLTPIWPPHIQQGNKHFHKNKCKAIYLLKSNNQIIDRKFVKIIENSEYPIDNVELISNGAIFTIEVTKDQIIIPQNDENVQFSPVISFNSSLEPTKYIPPIIQTQYGNKSIGDDKEVILCKNSKFSIKSNFKCNLCHIRDNHLRSLFRGMLSSPKITDIEEGDSFLTLHGLDIIQEIYFPIKNKRYNNSLNLEDKQIYQILLNKKGPYIPTPIVLKYILPKLKEYPKVKSYIQDSFRKGNIPKSAYDNIIMNFSGGTI